MFDGLVKTVKTYIEQEFFIKIFAENVKIVSLITIIWTHFLTQTSFGPGFAITMSVRI